MKHVIFDLDNCLSDDRHRLHLIDHNEPNLTARYQAYHAACGYDESANELTFIGQTKDAHPIFITARPNSVRLETQLWLKKVLECDYYLLLMRNTNDHRPSPEIKRDLLRSLYAYGIEISDIVMAFDDRPDVLAMYREEGVLASQLLIHGPGANIFKNNFSVHHHEDSGKTFDWAKMDAACNGAKAAPDFLEEGAATFRQRNALYGNTYHSFGEVAAKMFPKGVNLNTPDEFNRFALFMHCADKLGRYASQLHDGGHKDSAHDLMVYAAMLQEFTK